MNELSRTRLQRRVFVSAGLATLALAACSSVPRSIVPPGVDLESLSLLEGTADGQRYRLEMLLQNPNDVALPIRSLRFNVRLGGQGILMGESFEPFELAPGGSETLTLVIQTDLVASVSRLLSFVQGPDDRLAYELNGRLMLAGRPERSVPISVMGTVPLTATMGGAP